MRFNRGFLIVNGSHPRHHQVTVHRVVPVPVGETAVPSSELRVTCAPFASRISAAFCSDDVLYVELYWVLGERR